MKKSGLIAIIAIVLTMFFSAQGAMALMEGTEEAVEENLTALDQVKLFDMQKREMVRLVDLLEGKITILVLMDPSDKKSLPMNVSLTAIQKTLDKNEKMRGSFQIIGVMMTPFSEEKMKFESFERLREMMVAHYNIFVDLDTVNLKNLNFLARRFFVISYPHFVLIERNGSDYYSHIVRNTTSYEEIMGLMQAFVAGWSPFMKGLKED